MSVTKSNTSATSALSSIPPYLRFLTCPLCHAHFSKVGNAIRCENAHTFDIAKEGYINLLTKKLSGNMGDTKEMLQARRTFLDQQHYRPLATTITNVLYGYLKNEDDSQLPYLSLLDAGCGEGYYLGQLQEMLTQRLHNAHNAHDAHNAHIDYFGLDITKEATRMAAKRYKGMHFFVANIKERLPFASDSLHILLNIFAPRNIEEFARVTLTGGVVLVVIPTSRHLYQLRETLGLLGIEDLKQEHVIEQFTPHFTYLGATPVSAVLHLDQQALLQAVMMTPNYWHLTDETRRALSTIQELETEIACSCLLFRKDELQKKGIQETHR